MLFLLAATTTDNASSITPALGLFSTAVLLLLWLIKRLGADIKQTLWLQPSNIKWLVIGGLLGMVYWLLDHGLTVMVFQTNLQTTIAKWQTANSHYHWLSVLLSSVVLAPVFEELIFRGLLLKALTRQTSFHMAAPITAILFALIHWSWPGFISLMLVGMIYAYLTRLSGSVIPAILAHATHNLITYLFYSH